MYKCPHCKKVVTTTKRAHVCPATRALHGKMVSSVVVYQPNLPKQNKQSSQPEYMKRFGSRPVRIVPKPVAFKVAKIESLPRPDEQAEIIPVVEVIPA